MKQPGRIAIWIFMIVLLAVVILQAGRYSYVSDNSVTNFGPSGTSAFAELLRRSGYKVTIEKGFSPASTEKMVVPTSSWNQDALKKYLSGIASPASVVLFEIQDNFESEQTKPVKVKRDGATADTGTIEPFGLESNQWTKPLLDDAQSTDVLVTTSDGTVVARTIAKNNLKLVDARDATFVTNRNIEKADNADIAMSLVRMIAKPGDSLVLVDTFAAKSVDDSLLERLGGPYQAAWNQLLLVVLIIFLTLSVRFGLAPESRASQRGGRELVDGLATMTRRKGNARWALRAVFERTLTELERRHRVSREQIIQRPDHYLDIENAMILKAVEASTMNDISEDEAIHQAKQLKRLV